MEIILTQEQLLSPLLCPINQKLLALQALEIMRSKIAQTSQALLSQAVLYLLVIMRSKIAA